MTVQTTPRFDWLPMVDLSQLGDRHPTGKGEPTHMSPIGMLAKKQLYLPAKQLQTNRVGCHVLTDKIPHSDPCIKIITHDTEHVTLTASRERTL